MSAAESNEGERRRWNDAAWAAAWPKRERLTTAVTDVLLERAVLRPGDAVLDVGTGGGVAALASAARVADGGVVGADISAPLIELSRERAARAGADNVSFVLADVQQESVPGAPFDVAISQFGVMFFEDPKAAFANIRAQMVDGGRLAFACWSAIELNTWFPGGALVLAGLVPAPQPPAPGKSPTHPFSLSDAQQTATMLEASGWGDVASTSHELVVTVEREVIVDDEALGFFGVPEDSFAQAWEALDQRLAPITREDGRIDAPLAFHVFSATA